MNGTVTFTVAGNHLGRADVWLPEVAEATGRRESYWPHLRYLCPWCGCAWASVCYHAPTPADPATARSGMPPWQFIARACVTHGDGFIGDGIPATAMPAPLLRYLTQVAFDHFAKEQP